MSRSVPGRAPLPTAVVADVSLRSAGPPLKLVSSRKERAPPSRPPVHGPFVTQPFGGARRRSVVCGPLTRYWCSAGGRPPCSRLMAAAAAAVGRAAPPPGTSHLGDRQLAASRAAAATAGAPLPAPSENGRLSRAVAAADSPNRLSRRSRERASSAPLRRAVDRQPPARAVTVTPDRQQPGRRFSFGELLTVSGASPAAAESAGP